MHSRGWPITTAGLVLAAVVTASVASLAEDRVSGLITRTYVIVEDTELSGDVTCDVPGSSPCFSFGAPGVELRLNGYSITGKADPVTACGGVSTPGEFGITTGGQARVSIQGPGLVQRFRSHGVNVRLHGRPRPGHHGVQQLLVRHLRGGHVVRYGHRGQRIGPQWRDRGAVRRHMNRRP